MLQALNLTPPFFEIGPKAYLFGQKVVDLARWADEVSAKYNVQIIFTPQAVDLYRVAQVTRNLLVFAQHMDALQVGRGIGSVLPEAVKETGAVGVLLNHAEKPLSIEIIEQTIMRADEVRLASMVCAGNLKEVNAIARLKPNIILAEASDLIGTGKRDESDQNAIGVINRMVWDINPEIKVLHGAGITDEKDVYRIMMAGAQGTGSTSGILMAADPYVMLEKMIKSVREAWDLTHLKRTDK